ncbi:MAG: methyl-accepting chemotaxis protein [Rickettsiales bacterium]
MDFLHSLDVGKALHPLFSRIADPITPTIFLAILFALTGWGWWETYRLLRWGKRLFKTASKVIRDLAPEPKSKQFFEHFDEIDGKICEDSAIRPFWQEFSESAFPDAERRQICLTARPSNYLNKYAVLSAKGNVKQVQAYPNYLIGLGLFFTFLGLAAALDVAQSGLGSAEKSQSALQDLLAVASVKFISSLTAVLLSLLLSFWQRSAFNRCRKAISGFCSLIEERTEFMPTEKLMMRSLTELQKQTGFQANMAQNISDNLSALLAKSLPESVVGALQPLADEIRRLANSFQGSNHDALQKALDEFLTQLRQSSGKDMDSMVASVRTLKEALDVLIENMQGTSRNFGQDTKESTGRLAAVMERFSETFAPVQQGMAQFGQTLAALEGIAKQIEQAGGSINGAAGTNERAVANLSGAVDGISGQLEPIKETLQHLHGYMQLAGESARQMQQAGGTIETAADGFRRSADVIGQVHDKLADKMQAFSQAADNVSGTVVALKHASEQVSNAANPLTLASNGMEKAASAIHQTEARIQESQQELRRILEGIGAVSEALPKTLASYEQRFGKVDADMDRAFSRLSEGSLEFRESVNTFVAKLDENFTKAVSTLAGAIEELAEERAQQPTATSHG